MTTATARFQALMEGPPPRAPERITPETALRGRRVVVNLDSGEWSATLRAAEDPFWYDETALRRWPVGQEAPDDADAARARLFVELVTEADWYAWQASKRRPRTNIYPAYLVWAE